MKLLILPGILLGLLSTSVLAHDLSITVDKVKSTKGFLYVALYNSDTNWMKAGAFKAQKLSMTEKSVSVIFSDLPDGDYAVTLYQDENDSGQIDKNGMGIPTEPYGFSNNGGSFGPPSFEDSKITVTENKSITIYLQ